LAKKFCAQNFCCQEIDVKSFKAFCLCLSIGTRKIKLQLCKRLIQVGSNKNVMEKYLCPNPNRQLDEGAWGQTNICGQPQKIKCRFPSPLF